MGRVDEESIGSHYPNADGRPGPSCERAPRSSSGTLAWIATICGGNAVTFCFRSAIQRQLGSWRLTGAFREDSGRSRWVPRPHPGTVPGAFRKSGRELLIVTLREVRFTQSEGRSPACAGLGRRITVHVTRSQPLGAVN
jgi:hypothetical protein